MADVRVGGAYVNFTGRNAQFIQSVRQNGAAIRRQQRAVRAMRRTLRNFNRRVGETVKGITSWRTALGALAGAGALGLVIRQNVQYADEIAKSARATGLASSAFQELRLAFDLGGISANQFTRAMAAFSVRVGQARADSGELVEFLRRFDPDLLLRIQNTGSTEEAFGLILQTVSKLGNELDRTALLATAFGTRVGPRLANLLLQGTEGIDLLRQRARDLGVVIGDDLLTDAENLNDRMTELGYVIRTQTSRAVLQNADDILILVSALTTALPAAIQNAVVFITYLRENLELLSTVIGALVGASVGVRVGGAIGGLVGLIAGAAGGATLADALVISESDLLEVQERIAALENELAGIQRVAESYALASDSILQGATGPSFSDSLVAGLTARLEALRAEEAELIHRLRDPLAGTTPPVIDRPPIIPISELGAGITAIADRRPNSELERSLNFIDSLESSSARLASQIRIRINLLGIEGERRTELEARQEAFNRLTEFSLGQEQNLARAQQALNDARVSGDTLATTAAQARVDSINEAIAVITDQTDRIYESVIAHGELAAEMERISFASQIFSQVRTPLEIYNENIRRLDAALEDLLITQETYNRAVLMFGEQLRNSDEDLIRLRETADSISDAFATFTADVITDFDDIGDAAIRLAHSIVEEAFSAAVLDPIRERLTKAVSDGLVEGGENGSGFLGSLFGGGGSSGGGFDISSILTSVFGAVAGGGTGGVPVGRQGGGRVSSGRVYTVGEAGPELFSSRRSGEIFSNETSRAAAALGASAGSVVINFSPVIESDNEQAVERGLARAFPIFRSEAIEAVTTELGRHSRTREAARS